MFPVLEEDLQKQYEILTILDSEDRWWIGAELSEILGISPRTVHRYLYKLIDHLKAWPKQDIFIDVHANQGIRLIKAGSFNIYQVYSRLAWSSLIFKFLDNMFFNKTDSLMEFCIKNYVSVSSAYRKLYPVKVLTQGFNLQLRMSPPVLDGGETQKRYFYYTLYWEIYRGCEWPFKNTDRERLLWQVRELCSAFHCEMSESGTEQLLYWMAVNLTRIRQGHLLTDLSPFAFLTENNPLYRESSSWLDNVYEGIPQAGMEAEKQFLFAILHAFPYMDTIHSDMFRAAEKKVTCQPCRATRTWLRLFREHFQAETSEYFELQARSVPAVCDALEAQLNRLHCHAALFTGWSDLLERYPFLKNLRDDYPLFYQRLSRFYSVLLESDEKACFYDKDYLFPRYALLCSEYFDLTRCEKPIAIFLLTDYGPIYEKKVEREIQSRFDGIFRIYFSDAIEVCDIILTNIPHVRERNHLPLLNIREAFSEREWTALRQMMVNVQALDK